MPYFGRHHLVDRNSRVDIRAGGFFHSNTGEERAAGAGVVSGSIGPGQGIDLVHSLEDLKPVLQSLQRGHRRTQLEIPVFVLWPPVGLNRSVGEIHDSKPKWRT